jgi:hypothetical protein
MPPIRPGDEMRYRPDLLESKLNTVYHGLSWVSAQEEITGSAQVEEEENLGLCIVLDFIHVYLAVPEPFKTLWVFVFLRLEAFE